MSRCFQESLQESWHLTSATTYRLCLDGLPGLVLDKPSFPLSFAQWKGATAEDFWKASQWEGSSSGMLLQSSPLFMDLDVRNTAASARKAAHPGVLALTQPLCPCSSSRWLRERTLSSRCD